MCLCRESELALSEANACDPEHPSVWGYLALLYLQQGRDADAQAALTQAHRHGLADPQLLMDIADQYQAAGRFSQAGRLLRRILEVGSDSVKVSYCTCDYSSEVGLELQAPGAAADDAGVGVRETAAHCATVAVVAPW